MAGMLFMLGGITVVGLILAFWPVKKKVEK